MILRIALVAAVLGLAGFALWHPAGNAAPIGSIVRQTAPPASLAAWPPPFPSRRHRQRGGPAAAGGEAVVYVVGAVRKPGLYRVRTDARVADAVALAGGLDAAADPAGINLAAHVSDGDEIDAPVAGASVPVRTRRPRTRSRARTASPPPAGTIDPNAATVAQLARVPGFGRIIAARIVEMRERDGAFTSIDELLDVSGMTQSRLDRALPYLQSP